MEFSKDVLQRNTAYYVSLTSTDPDGIDGVNPQIVGPLFTPAEFELNPPSPAGNTNLTEAAGSEASSYFCGVSNVTGQYRILPEAVSRDGIYLIQSFGLQNAGPRAYPSLFYVVPVPISANWRLLGSFRVTHCFSAAGNYLVPLPSLAPGQVEWNFGLADYSVNPQLSPPFFFGAGEPQYVLSGLPSR